MVVIRVPGANGKLHGLAVHLGRHRWKGLAAFDGVGSRVSVLPSGGDETIDKVERIIITIGGPGEEPVPLWVSNAAIADERPK
jgi:hypothetical protein